MARIGRPSCLRRRVLIAASGVALAAPAAAQRANRPNQPVRFIGIFPPGGATDVLSRIWCQKMSEITGQQFVVESRSGSGGNVGTEVIARANPDGIRSASPRSPRWRSRPRSTGACLST